MCNFLHGHIMQMISEHESCTAVAGGGHMGACTPLLYTVPLQGELQVIAALHDRLLRIAMQHTIGRRIPYFRDGIARLQAALLCKRVGINLWTRRTKGRLGMQINWKPFKGRLV
jgi:hypothetical protein